MVGACILLVAPDELKHGVSCILGYEGRHLQKRKICYLMHVHAMITQRHGKYYSTVTKFQRSSSKYAMHEIYTDILVLHDRFRESIHQVTHTRFWCEKRRSWWYGKAKSSNFSLGDASHMMFS